MMNILAVAVGGAVGSVCRYLISVFFTGRYSGAFPLATLTANIIGGFLIGLFMGFILKSTEISPLVRLVAVVGFLGGLTTFSSFSYETVKLIQEAKFDLAMANILLSLILSFSATWLGLYAAKEFNVLL